MTKQIIIQEWTKLKKRIISCQPFLANQKLIREAVEFYLYQASSFTSEHSNPPLLNRRSIEQAKERLTKQLADLTQQPAELGGRDPDYFASEKEKIKSELTRIEVALTESSTAQEAFTRQKEKNELIVKECGELLGKLRS